MGKTFKDRKNKFDDYEFYHEKKIREIYENRKRKNEQKERPEKEKDKIYRHH